MTSPHPLDPAQAAQWLTDLPGPPACAHVDNLRREAPDSGSSDQPAEALPAALVALTQAGANGHRGVQHAIEQLRRDYLDPPTLRAVEQWRHALLNAIAASITSSPATTTRCDCQSPAPGYTEPVTPTPTAATAATPRQPPADADAVVLAAQLDQLDVPARAGRHLARRALQDAGITAADRTLEAALRHRKQQPHTPADAPARGQHNNAVSP